MLILLIASVFPVLIFMYLIYLRDTIKEPLSTLFRAFFAGILSVVLAVILGLVISPIGEFLKESAMGYSFFNAFITAGLIEEFSKFLLLYLFIWKHKNFDQNYDGIIYAVFASLGFALVENILYVFQGGLSTAIMRAVLAVPGHGFFAVIMGYYFSLAKFNHNQQRSLLLIQAIMIPALIHGSYDFCLMYMSHENSNILLSLLLLIAFTVLVIGFWRLGFKKIKKHIQKDKELGVFE
ncbi:MAG: PrsW family intramembrane metalloprotease [Bacteroidetes bacterium]|nr:PrsW family intramembrane metalloprotease [Bacteroidota bacterium]